MTDRSRIRCRHCRRAVPRDLVLAADGCCPWCDRQLMPAAGAPRAPRVPRPAAPVAGSRANPARGPVLLRD